MKLQGKVALVTGGGAGIGAAITKRFVEEGAKVCITGRRKEVLDKMVQSLPKGSVATCSGDVSKDKDVARMVETTVKFGGTLNILVNNAGINRHGPVADLDHAVWHEVMGVNLHGPFMMMQESIPHMIKAGGGSIINIASLGGLRCLPGFPAYCASKAGLIHLTKQVALDYGAHNIRCNAVCPGGIKTEMTEQEFGQFGKMIGMEADAYLDLIAEDMPLKRFGEPHEIGGVCTFLASDDSSFMTGAALLIDAGTAVVDVVGASIMGSLRRGGAI